MNCCNVWLWQPNGQTKSAEKAGAGCAPTAAPARQRPQSLTFLGKVTSISQATAGQWPQGSKTLLGIILCRCQEPEVSGRKMKAIHSSNDTSLWYNKVIWTQSSKVRKARKDWWLEKYYISKVWQAIKRNCSFYDCAAGASPGLFILDIELSITYLVSAFQKTFWCQLLKESKHKEKETGLIPNR